VRSYVTIGGIQQPVIGQRKVEHGIRVREGEVSLLGGLVQDQYTKSKGGVPGLSGIPGLGRLLSSDSTERDGNEPLIALAPHIVRTPGITDLNLGGIAAGTEQSVKVTLAPKARP
jgi:general secretion pathway protein D